MGQASLPRQHARCPCDLEKRIEHPTNQATNPREFQRAAVTHRDLREHEQAGKHRNLHRRIRLNSHRQTATLLIRVTNRRPALETRNQAQDPPEDQHRQHVNPYLNNLDRRRFGTMSCLILIMRLNPC